MRLYRVQTECRKCDHRYRDWVSETQRNAAFQRPETELLNVPVCPRERCGNDIPITAKHVREAVFDAGRTEAVARNPLLRNLRLRPDLSPSVPRLTERQAKVCTLILEGLTDRKIGALLRLPRPTVRKHIQNAARRLCEDAPTACRVFPRQTIVAFFRERATDADPAEVFKTPA